MKGRLWLLVVTHLCALWLCSGVTNLTAVGENTLAITQLPKLDVHISLNRTEVQCGETLLVSVVVTSGGNGVQGVYVEFWLSQEGGVFSPQNTTTDAFGKAESILKTPITQITLECTISVNAAKEGYESGMNNVQFTLLPLPRLDVSVSADALQVYNNQSVNITVIVTHDGLPVKNATVRMGLAQGLRETGEEYFQPSNGTTNEEGKFFCTFMPPYVTNETEFGICVSAYADGYSENTTFIVIKVLPKPGGGEIPPNQKTPDYTVPLAVGIFCVVSLCAFLRRRWGR